MHYLYILSNYKGNNKFGASLVVQGKIVDLPVQEIRVQSLRQEDFLEKGMATHSSILARIIP